LDERELHSSVRCNDLLRLDVVRNVAVGVGAALIRHGPRKASDEAMNNGAQNAHQNSQGEVIPHKKSTMLLMLLRRAAGELQEGETLEKERYMEDGHIVDRPRRTEEELEMNGVKRREAGWNWFGGK
jgi:hypothetical protein